MHQRPAAEDEVDALRHHRLDQAAMQIGAARPELQHVAEHRDAAALPRDVGLAEQRDGRLHRGRIGVVALVDQQRAPAGKLELAARAAAGRRREPGERERRQREIGARERGRGQHRQRIHHDMAAGRAELVGDVGAEDAAPAPSSSPDAATT